ncbi:MAG TPA: hypothetical protein PLM34_11120, partial [Lentimicrobium sp.]|nr:hypothetical protein [Lentimicrobium sp.]
PFWDSANSPQTLAERFATGLFESTNNLCAEVLVTKDSTFHFKTDTAGIYLFIAYSAAYQPIYDTLVVSDTATSKR